MGLIVALATAWTTIDWVNFNLNKEWPKLAITGAIAIGGIVTKLNVKEVVAEKFKSSEEKN